MGQHGEVREEHSPELVEATEEIAEVTGTSVWRLVGRLLFLLVAAVALYGLAPQLIDVWAELPQLRHVNWLWFPVMLGLAAVSLVCLWWLVRIALPQVSWFLAGTSQLAGNAVTKFVPGGPPIGAALQYRMLSVAGVGPGSAATALGATGLLATWVLFAVPLVAVGVSLVGSPVPGSMIHVAWGGAMVFVLMFLAGLAITRSDRLLEFVGGPIERANRWLFTRLGRTGGITVHGLKEQRDEMVGTLGGNFRNALGAAMGKWLFEYLVLVAALLAIGARPRLSLVLLAFATSAVLGMIPITPGGLGFVEAGLTAMLTLSGVSGSDALLATLAFRLFTYWLPLPAGLIAYLAFRRRYGRPPEEREAQERPAV